MTDDICGSTETLSGEPCQHDPTESDGYCWQHTKAGEKSVGGRPTKLSYERQERIATAIEEGVPVVAACRLNEIGYDTYRRWMDKGKEEAEGPHADFYERLTRALGHDQREKTAKLWEAAEERGDTDTMLTILKQRYPETWDDTNIGEVKGAMETWFSAPADVREITEDDIVHNS